MSSALASRVVVVRRATGWELLIEEHGTAAQDWFYLGRQGQGMADVEEQSARRARGRGSSIPRAWRQLTLLRSDLDWKRAQAALPPPLACTKADLG
jgi:hypothetical protein